MQRSDQQILGTKIVEKEEGRKEKKDERMSNRRRQSRGRVRTSLEVFTGITLAVII
jgi:hypothetical protein